MASSLFLGKAKAPIHLEAAMANRHGLIAGATGTGKTITLQVLAEEFSAIGVPVFLADVKGDLGGMALPGSMTGKVAERARELGLADFTPRGCPVVFWDLFGEQGHPVRTTVSDMGPLLLSRLLGLNDTQAGVLTMAFRVADDNGWLLLDLKDLRAMLQHLGDNAADLRTGYGNVSAASVGTIQRALLALEEQGGEKFFGEPALDINDFLQTQGGRGVVNILAADRLLRAPQLYATFLLWLLAELFEELPEAGDPEKPKLVFFFDEAHLLFDEAPKPLLDTIEQVVRLIRSKGVGVYFVTQNPIDIPDTVLGQLGNRVQHALRAYTPRDGRAVRAAAETFRANPDFDVLAAITELAVGEALVSTLDAKGRPQVVERTLIRPPASMIGPIEPAARRDLIAASVLAGHYEKQMDRESAYELLRARAEAMQAEAERRQAELAAAKTARSGGSNRMGLGEAIAKSAMHAIGSQLGRQIVRGLLGSILGGRKR
ncbi:MAG: helicase HerA-like domain-containing protein [Thermodesulfobacteriota bacterium]